MSSPYNNSSQDYFVTRFPHTLPIKLTTNRSIPAVNTPMHTLDSTSLPISPGGPFLTSVLHHGTTFLLPCVSSSYLPSFKPFLSKNSIVSLSSCLYPSIQCQTHYILVSFILLLNISTSFFKVYFLNSYF